MPAAPNYAKVRTFQRVGVTAVPVEVEVHIQRRLPSTAIIGMQAATVRECAERVRSAVVACGFEWPRRRVAISLSPADLRKCGTAHDLPIAVAVLVASGQLPAERIDRFSFYGELSLLGVVRRCRGALAAALQCRSTTLVVDPESAQKVCNSLLDEMQEALPLYTLRDLPSLLAGEIKAPPYAPEARPPSMLDFADIHGQDEAINQLLTAVATRRPVVLRGPPGCGKTMLAARAAGLLPRPSPSEQLRFAILRDVIGLPNAAPAQRPFRAPHHSISAEGLLGNVSTTMPGEACLANGGVLFLDELPEFPRHTLKALRSVMAEDGINLGGAARPPEGFVPANFWLIAATNPCPCGYRSHPTRACVCSTEMVERYAKRIERTVVAGALYIDLAPTPAQDLTRGKRGRSTADLRKLLYPTE